jgi:serine/threonine-protein kinase
MSSSLPPPPLSPGAKLDRYELLAPIATGGMASVWVARLKGKRGFEKLVALKAVRPDLASDPHVQRMFLDEANLASSIRHPNVAEIIDLGEHHGHLYLVMEWIDGDSLSALRKALAAKGLEVPLRLSLRIVADACAGLHAAHELRGPQGEPVGLVHRDVSPQNILLTMSGGTKVIDFGVAKALGRVADETAAGLVKGKVHYMAPEQACGGRIDRRVDVWALGVVLYQLLSGRYPYEGDNQLATLHLVASGKPPPPIPGLAPDVASVVAQALAHDPLQRYASAADLERALERVIAAQCGPTRSDDVAAFVREHLGERVAGRRRTIERALEAANERARVEAELAAAAALDKDAESDVEVVSTVPPTAASGAFTRPSDTTGLYPEPLFALPARAVPAAPEPQTLAATSTEHAMASASRRRMVRNAVGAVFGVAVLLLAVAFAFREMQRLQRPGENALATASRPSSSAPAEIARAPGSAAETPPAVSAGASGSAPPLSSSRAGSSDAGDAAPSASGTPRGAGGRAGPAPTTPRGTDPTDVFGERR